MWDELPKSHIVDDGYYAKVLPTLDRQLRLAGLRLAGGLQVTSGAACRAR